MIGHIEFEEALCNYTGASFVVLVDSCTNAIELVCRYLEIEEASIPRYTWRGVPRAIRRAGARVYIEDRAWTGAYQLRPTPIWDSARRFYAGMYKSGTFTCVSFHFKKILGHTRGGAILCDSWDAWRNMTLMTRDDGRRGMHCYMPSDVAAALHMKLACLELHNADLIAPEGHYPDLMSIDWNAMT